MDEEIKKRFDEQEARLIALYASAEKTRKMFLWTLIITVVTIVLPLVGLVFIIPRIFSMFSLSGLGGLGL